VKYNGINEKEKDQLTPCWTLKVVVL